MSLVKLVRAPRWRSVRPWSSRCVAALTVLPWMAQGASLEIIPNCREPQLARDGSGMVAVESTFSDSDRRVVRWMPAAGVQRFPGYPKPFFIQAASRNGSVATGTYRDGHHPGLGDYQRAFSWTAEGGFETLPNYYDVDEARYWSPMGISLDGTTILGTQIGFPSAVAEPVVWTDRQVDSPFRPFPGGFSDASAIVSNADGSVIFGWLSTNGVNENHFDFFRWTEKTGTVGILRPPGIFNSQFRSAAPESESILGRGNILGQGWIGFVMREGAVDLIPPTSDGAVFIPWDITADGATVLGYTQGGVNGTSYLWSVEEGYRDVGLWLTEALQLDLKGWSLKTARRISADGRVMSFNGVRYPPNSYSPEYSCIIVTLPEPGADIPALAALLSAHLIARCRARRSGPMLTGAS